MCRIYRFVRLCSSLGGDGAAETTYSKSGCPKKVSARRGFLAPLGKASSYRSRLSVPVSACQPFLLTQVHFRHFICVVIILVIVQNLDIVLSIHFDRIPDDLAVKSVIGFHTI